ncbi:MAG: hypothetical protein IJ055_06085 [Oscillospiraceae bacterium]|nr:hypothetical protein [Oscillospiraceae bacterium]
MILIGAWISLLAENLVLSGALGTSTLMAATRNRSSLPALALVMTLFSGLAALCTACVTTLLHLQETAYPYSLVLPLLYTAVVGVLYLTVLALLQLLLKQWFAPYKKYIHLAAFNCAVMGTLYKAFDPVSLHRTGAVQMLRYDGSYLHVTGPWSAMLFGLHMGLGFVLTALLLTAVRARLYNREVPAAFRGFPAVLAFLGVLSMAVYAIFQ